MTELQQKLIELHTLEKSLAAQLVEVKKQKRTVAGLVRDELIENQTQSVKLSDGMYTFTIFLRTLTFATPKEGISKDYIMEILENSDDVSLRGLVKESYDSRALTRAVRDIIEADRSSDFATLIGALDLKESTEVAVRAS